MTTVHRVVSTTLAAACLLVSADIRLSSTVHGEIVIPVFIGGEGPYWFLLLDTGSSHIAARVVPRAGTVEDGDGLLPLSLFARVSFRHREGYMAVQPR